MFAVVVNELQEGHRDFAVDVIMNFVTFSSCRDSQALLAWAAPGADFVCWRSSGRCSNVMAFMSDVQDVVESAVAEKRCLIGVNRWSGCDFRYGDNFALASHSGNELLIEVCPTTAVLSLCRRVNRPIWAGWFRQSGLDMVLVHEQRSAIESSTGRCGCLFDEQMQMYLLEMGKLMVYELGSHATKLSSIDDVKKETGT